MNKNLKKSIHFLNEQFVEEEDLKISPRDLGYARGYAIVDFLVTHNNKPFKLTEHINRLFNSASLIGLKIPWTRSQIIDWITRTLSKNPPGEKVIKIIISGGNSTFLLPQSETPTIVIMVDPRKPMPERLYTEGMEVIAVEFTRYSPHAKTNNYIEAVKQAQIAKAKGASEAIYFDKTQVYESSTSNIFALIDRKLKTPKTNVLGGVTRDVLLEILKLKIPIIVEDFTLDDLLKAEEVFLTSSNREIAPVVKIDGKNIGNGEVGEITKEVMKQYKEYTSKN